MRRPLTQCVLAVATILALTACETSPTEPAIVPVTVPGTFELQATGYLQGTLSGTADFSSSGEDFVAPGVSMRTAGSDYDEVAIRRNLVASGPVPPIPTGMHRFAVLGGNRGWNVHFSRVGTGGLRNIVGMASSGSMEITESSDTAVRGVLDVSITTFVDGQPRSSRIRGSFWATPTAGPPAQR